MDKAHIDFETLSGSDIRSEGAEKYARHPSTGIMCIGIGWNDEMPAIMGVARRLPVGYQRDPNLSHFNLASGAEWTRLLDHVKRGGPVVAHNAPFELAIWNNVGVKKYGWPELRPGQMDCTMARAYAMALPGSLDGARAAVGIETEKDMKGNRLMLKLSQPKSRQPCSACYGLTALGGGTCSNCGSAGELYTWHENREDIEKLFSYCATDILVERELDHRLAPLSPREKQVWQLDYKINNVGVRVDLEAAEAARRVVELEEDRLDEEMRDVTLQQVATCKAHVQLKNWIISHGIETEGVAKNDVAILLTNPDLPVSIRCALSLRQEAAKASTAKLAAMLDRACSDERLRGIHQYHGANTGRWAGRGVQTHNFPRGNMKPDVIESLFSLLSSGTATAECRDLIEVFFGAPMAAISNCLRGFIVPTKGKDFIAVDWSAIEARKTAWLAGEESVLEIFRTHGKIYEDAAAKTYRCPIELITKDDPRRQVGKVEVLALGFGGGVGALQAMCQSLGLTLEPLFEGLWQLAGQERRDRALTRYKSEVTKALNKSDKEWKKHLEGKPNDWKRIYPGRETGITQKEWLASELVKMSWREANPNIVRYWSLIELAAIRAVQQAGKSFRVAEHLPPVSFQMSGSFLRCTLPSGRRLTYPYPKVSTEETPWGAPKHTLTYMSEDSVTRRWVRCKTYGGSLTENVVQASARDLLADAMLRLDEKGKEIVMHVHDEVVIEAPPWDGRGVDFGLKTLEKIVSEVPAWASGLPIAAEGWRGKRYRK